MACFLVPAAEAVITTIATKVMKKKEQSSGKDHDKKNGIVEITLDGQHTETVEKRPFSSKMKWLNNLLWGGSGLLMFEHLWHGEVVPWFPFLTAAQDPESTSEMLHEMSTVGVTMAVAVTAVWGVMVAVSSALQKRAEKDAEKISEEEQTAEE